MNRRRLISGAPVAALAAALSAGNVQQAIAQTAAVAFEHTDTPIMALYAEWHALFNRLETAGREEIGDEAYDAEVDRRIAMEDRVTEMQPVTVQDVYAKILILTMHGFHDLPGPEYCPKFWDEAQAAIAA